MDAITKAYDGDIQMIDNSVTRVHQHAANVKKAPPSLYGPLPRRIDNQGPRAHRCAGGADQEKWFGLFEQFRAVS